MAAKTETDTVNIHGIGGVFRLVSGALVAGVCCGYRM
jgi:hypothetical protein